MADWNAVVAPLRSAMDGKTLSDSDSYAKLAGALSAFEAGLREHLQGTTMREMQQIIKKLQGTAPLSPAELNTVKSWIVGDADHYTRVENNYEDWMAELKRLLDEITASSRTVPDAERAGCLRALLRDAIRVTWDIHYYLEQKERLPLFQESTQVLDAEERAALAELLAAKLKSDSI